MDDPIEVVNLGTLENPKSLRIGGNLRRDEKDKLIKLLADCLDVFAWSYNDMPGLDPSIVVHKLPTQKGVKPKR